MIKTFIYKGKDYPAYEKSWFASRFAFPFALEVCKGTGYDIGFCKEEWKFPGAIGIEKNDELPKEQVDYVISSHTLEHTLNWIETLDNWTSIIKVGGVLFLYLPYYTPGEDHYWNCWNNRKHLHNFIPEMIYDYMINRGYIKIFYSGKDLNSSFCIMGEKT